MRPYRIPRILYSECWKEGDGQAAWAGRHQIPFGPGSTAEHIEPRMVSKNQDGLDTSATDDVVFGSRIAGLYRKMERGHNVGAIDASRSPIHPYWRLPLL